MLVKVKNYVEKWHMLSSEDCVIVGVSGGADSVCLLLVLVELKKEKSFSLIAVHVNHGLRGADADSDEMYVRELCEKTNVPLEVYSVDVNAVAKSRKQSIEETGRNIRKECFEQARHKYNGTRIALAHHQNDNAETFLFRLARGTGIKGLCGMKPVNEHFIRPFLCVNRAEIEQYMEQCGVPYCTDATNEENVYTRNLIRNQVIPRIEDGVNVKAVEHINKTMEYMWQIEDYMQGQTDHYFQICVRQTETGYVICESGYQDVPDVLKLLLIRKTMVLVSKKEKDLEEIHFKQVDDLFEKQSGRRVDLPYRMEARRVYEGVEICRNMGEKVDAAEEICCDLETERESYRWKNFKISYEILNKTEADGETLEKSHTKRFDCDIIKQGLCFRTRRPGDYITIHPDGKTQKLKTFFINEKIPLDQRDKILLIADGQHILWVVGYRENCAYKVKEHTKRMLIIQVDKGEEHGRDN